MSLWNKWREWFSVFVTHKDISKIDANCNTKMCSQTLLSNYVIYLFCLQQFQYSSCKELKKKRPDSISGIYEFKTKNGDTISAYCDMVTDGGTLIISFHFDNHWASLNHRQPSLHPLSIVFSFWMKFLRNKKASPWL